MKKAFLLLVGIMMFAGCAYTTPAVVSADRVVMVRNDGLLFGALRKVFVCKATDNGLTNCRTAESP